MAKRARESRGAVWLRRAAWWGGGLLLAAFALEGGEFGTSDVLALVARERQMIADSVALAATVDSLQRERDLVAEDDATIERIAREEFGMVGSERELVFRFLDEVEDSTADGGPDGR